MVIVCSIGVPAPTLASSPSARRSGSPSVGVHCVPSKFSRAISRQYAAVRGLHGEHLDVGPVDQPRADVDERVEHLGGVAALVVRVEQRAARRARQARGEHTGGERRRRWRRPGWPGAPTPIVRRPAPIHAASSRAWEKRSTAMTTIAVPIHSAETRTRLRSVPERRGEHEDHAGGDDRLGPPVGAEGERVGQQRARGQQRGGGHGEAALARHRGDGAGELLPHEAQVGADELDRLPGRQQEAGGVAVVDDRQQHEADQQRRPAGRSTPRTRTKRITAAAACTPMTTASSWRR